MIRAVVFDLGEVLSSPPSLLPTLAARAGVGVDLLERNYWAGRPAYDAGGSETDYWGRLLAAVGVEPDDALCADLARLDSGVWADLRPTAWQLLRDCRAAGAVVAVLSNSPHAMQRAADAADWRVDVDHLFISATLGLMKPDPAIYRAVATRLGLEGPAIAFVDDKQANVDGALTVGWRAHLWTGDDDTRAWLTTIGVLDG